ncbi:MAG: glycerophosphodiester phosphodiesterase [Thermoplasmata archaeon]|nr:glycerophosphodiester phosphodiesterase [Thermoplasmata archaeon]
MFLIIGHRGASGTEPENTLRSFRKAVDMGADGIELDVHTCATGEIVVIHDDTVDRTTNGSGKVSDLSLDRLRELDAGSGERIPLLTEVLDLIGGRVLVNIELKGDDTARGVGSVISSYLGRGYGPEDLLVSSFKPTELSDLISIRDDIRIGVLFEDHPEMYLDFSHQIGAYSVHPGKDLVTPSLVRRSVDIGCHVLAWSVNDREEADVLRSMGVNGIFTDHPQYWTRG